MRSNRPLTLSLIGLFGLATLAACGGGGGDEGGEKADLPAECTTNSTLQITSPGLDALGGEFTPTDTVIYQGKIVPGVELFGKSQDELKALEEQSIGTAYRAIVADFPIKDNLIMPGFSSFLSRPENGGTHFYFGFFPKAPGPWTVGDVLDVTTPAAYLEDLPSSSGSHISLYFESSIESSFMIGGFVTEYSGTAKVLAVDDKNLCIDVDYTAPVLGEDGMFNVKGIISGRVEPHITGDLAS